MNSTINKEQAYQTGCWHFVQPCILVQKTTYHPFKWHTHTHTKKKTPSKIPTKKTLSKPTNKPQLLSIVIYTINVTIPKLQSRLVGWNTVLNKTVILHQQINICLAYGSVLTTSPEFWSSVHIKKVAKKWEGMRKFHVTKQKQLGIM